MAYNRKSMWTISVDLSDTGRPNGKRPKGIRRPAKALFGLALLLCPFEAGHAAEPARPPSAPSASGRPIPPADIDDDLEIGGTDISGHKVSTRMTVDARVNGNGPYRFVVDSGADTSVIGARIAQSLQLPSGTPVLLNDTTSSSRVDRVLVNRLGFGSSEIENLQLPVLSERNIGADGLIGIDALVKQRLMLDFETRLIKVEDTSRPVPHAEGEIVVTARRRGGQLILTQAKVNGKAVAAVIDTGSEVTIGNLALRDQLTRRAGAKLTPITVSGVTGVTMNLEMAEVAELRIGSILLQDVPIAFAQLPPFAVFGLADQPALLLGTDLMNSFRRVSLDFRTRKVRFQLRRCTSQPLNLNVDESAARSRLSAARGSDQACRR